MSFQAYLDNIKAKTGKTPEDIRELAKKEGLLQPGVKTGQIVVWLKSEFGLGHGHAMAIVATLQSADGPKLSTDDKVAKQFAGAKAGWRKGYDALLSQVNAFGSGITISPTDTYISLLRGDKKFAIVGITAQRMDIGIKLKGAAPSERFEPAGSWNAMVTHRVRIDDPNQIDSELVSWLRQAYDHAN